MTDSTRTESMKSLARAITKIMLCKEKSAVARLSLLRAKTLSKRVCFGMDAFKARLGSKPSKASVPKSVPWVEKYRPRSVLDVAFQEEVVAVLHKCLAKGGADLPNLLFYGPPGTGKTSTILAAARDLYGPELYKTRVLELNASDERGISVVRDQIKSFARQTASAISATSSSKSCPAFKIVVLDEADSMTRDAQSALRRIMEKEGGSTRFCLVCNYVSRIIEPITSRCAKFRFRPLPRHVLKERVAFVAEKEEVGMDEHALDALLRSCEGDLRKAITTLQSASKMIEAKTDLEQEIIDDIAGVVPQKWIDKLIQCCAQNTNNFEKVQMVVEEIKAEGFSIIALLSQLHDYVIVDERNEFNDDQKAHICETLAVSENRLLDGASESLQLLDVALVIMQTLGNRGD